MITEGNIIKIAGPVIIADGMRGTQMHEMVKVGSDKLIGEIIELEGDTATIQVYEETAGLKPGEKIESTGGPLSVELGPGIMGSIFDGIQRPLEVIKEKTGDFIERGVDVPSIDKEKKWTFKPVAKVGDKVQGGDILGEVQETSAVLQKILLPPTIEGTVKSIVSSGEFTVEEDIAEIETADGVKKVQMLQKWPVRKGRPYKDKLDPDVPLVTGQRTQDTFFPVAKGGTAAIPGPFGSGKTVTQQQLAKWSDADIIVYVGCGERGNEMTEVLLEFPELEDPKTGNPLMDRTVLIANTSNMPVAAREACVYTGITIAEYFRDQGYDVALMADSTSRWAEAMREISGRLEEMPGEEGYPAYLASRLAQFYERAGRVNTLGSESKVSSVSVVGAVSPPGGDLSEPVTQNTLRICKVFWALDASLADKRHFPSIDWLQSYSLYVDSVQEWWKETVGGDWRSARDEAMVLLQKESELQEIVQLVGPDALPDSEQVTLETTRMLREDFLQQNAYHEVDTYCSPSKQFQLLSTIILFQKEANKALERGATSKDIIGLSVKEEIGRLKFIAEDEFPTKVKSVQEEIIKQCGEV
ncbi:MAG: ATP synthase subunit A [Methanobrevibacter arboriphilus]|jgi:V/A-type H+-transporting ATPase subunit A|uniref:A-type ATP synthase subunit A n=2 Tax=Methanobrevibacter arboriphilus TaxID=39441 RepID=A0A843AEH6_METAZ|nr:ATP synthase subunit A [Methanobrevibacter arboriphilus]MBF4468171.1 ATP synthase subunit A [Methanobrevibacter arboriphilus]BBL62753.1 ATP synthase subunit A [Methanobrevibacter arboriphilus]GLI11993.1 ATP synthase subunit A [Methanobrevibacter arboriphilus]